MEHEVALEERLVLDPLERPMEGLLGRALVELGSASWIPVPAGWDPVDLYDEPGHGRWELVEGGEAHLVGW